MEDTEHIYAAGSPVSVVSSKLAAHRKVDAVVAIPHVHYCTVPGLQFVVTWAPAQHLLTRDAVDGE